MTMTMTMTSKDVRVLREEETLTVGGGKSSIIEVPPPEPPLLPRLAVPIDMPGPHSRTQPLQA
jgi:hypothetical protein